MPFSRYLYSKVKEATQDNISLVLTQTEIEFLKFHHIPFEKNSNNEIPSYTVSSKLIKCLFCN